MSILDSTCTNNLALVSKERPYVAFWTDQAGTTFYVGLDEACGGQSLVVTDDRSKAAGYPTGPACAASIMANGFQIPNATWVDIAHYSEPRCQLGLF